jgi:U3 small nucleolar ribonucleoprotein protein LCP5
VEEYPELIADLLQKVQNDKVEGVSLLALKNNALLSYLDNLSLIVLSHLQRLEEAEDPSRLDAIKSSIVQRVTLEKGIKPLEKKLSYQLDKMVRSYNRMEADDTKLQKKVSKQQDASEEEDSESDGGSDNSEEDSSDEEETNYRPDAMALAKMTGKSKSSKSSEASSSTREKYKPPRLTAMAPPTSIKDIDAKDKKGKQQKLHSMEEYLREQSDTPMVETSIGSTIVDHGRGGVKTQHDRNKEKEIQDYEENNFTRLPQNQTKKSFQQKQRDMRNTFGGEDWSMFNNDRDVSSGTSRKRKPNSVWDRAKKKRN